MNVKTINPLMIVYFYAEELDHHKEIDISFKTVNKPIEFGLMKWLEEACDKYILENDIPYRETWEVLFKFDVGFDDDKQPIAWFEPVYKQEHLWEDEEEQNET